MNMSRVQFVVSIPSTAEERRIIDQREIRAASINEKGNDNLAYQENDKTVKTTPITMEQILTKIISELNVANPIWITDKSLRYKQVSFFVCSGEDYNTVLKVLSDNEIGAKKNSCVSILPCSLFYQKDGTIRSPKGKNVLSSKSKYDIANDTAWDKFVQSVQPRIIVSQVLESVHYKATLTFDYLVLLLIAALTAALGLVEDSTVILVASMLISPMMGPVIAGMFGTVIPDKKLQKIGVLNGLLSLLLCVFIGFLFGVCVDLLETHQDDIWPTTEMTTRGELRALWVGTMIAVLSGGAIALAILSDNTESVIGVAISAALLPPAVNAGLFWALAVVNQFYHKSVSFETHEILWSPHPTTEFITLGAISICLTLLNIIFIFITGIIILKVKDVTPKEENNVPWNPIQMVREYKPLTDEEAHTITEKFGDSFAKDDLPVGILRRLSHYGIFNELTRSHLHTWSPGMGNMKQRPSLKEITVQLSAQLPPDGQPPWSPDTTLQIQHSLSPASTVQEELQDLQNLDDGKAVRRFTVSPTPPPYQ
ncbi:uncharacterized protein LOC106670435 isoform X1 [Cimex lectularius]|uniref:DUF389 domain-containing protein n=1 Tax=Cimex lectularius TaxID=79782 RepID=A0A8I6S558_CIMLE|nr:uncharacterized protein LOC106670435 isoform X1 [Cimex lectularius]